MHRLTKRLSRETTSMVAIAIGGMVGGLLEWFIVVEAVSYLLK
jgi:hypothetical protein